MHCAQCALEKQCTVNHVINFFQALACCCWPPLGVSISCSSPLVDWPESMSSCQDEFPGVSGERFTNNLLMMNFKFAGSWMELYFAINLNVLIWSQEKNAGNFFFFLITTNVWVISDNNFQIILGKYSFWYFIDQLTHCPREIWQYF